MSSYGEYILNYLLWITTVTTYKYIWDSQLCLTEEFPWNYLKIIFKSHISILSGTTPTTLPPKKRKETTGGYYWNSDGEDNEWLFLNDF